MYAKRIQIANCGPIGQLDITFPTDEEGKPLPTVLVGENGSGKSIFLSHIVNSLMLAQQRAFPDTPEVESGKVYKVRSPIYVTRGRDFSFARVDFTDDFWFGELQLNRSKQNHDTAPNGVAGTDAQFIWDKMAATAASHIRHEGFRDRSRVENMFQANCILYFPPDRFEEPAWLNEANLNARAQHLERKPMKGSTDRKVLTYSPLRANQNWLFGLAYDFSVFERKSVSLPVVVDQQSGSTIRIPATIDYPGRSRRLYDIALQIVREVVSPKEDTRLAIGPRHDRVVSVMRGEQMLVPNIFQLSSGQVSLLNLFLSILRDYDSTQNQLAGAQDISGIVVVDEIDLHLHSHHQIETLPKLLKLFPKVQFIITSHSPLFVLGLQEVVGEDGFGLYHLPEGQQISPEAFSEFGAAYQAFANTQRHFNEIRSAVKGAQKPIIFVDGKTDVKYHEKAAILLGYGSILNQAEFRDGAGMLSNIWKGLTKDHVDRNKVIVLHDPEENVNPAIRANVYRRRIPRKEDHPIQKGVENLFSKATLKRASDYKDAFIDIDPSREKRKRGLPVRVPETWTVNEDEKANLCCWLCENGTEDDFQHFRTVLDMLRNILEETSGDTN